MSLKKSACKPNPDFELNFKSSGKTEEEAYSEELLILKQLVKSDPLLISFSTLFSEEFLLGFLRGRKYDVQAAHKTLQNYIKVRRDKYPEIFRDLRPSKLLHILENKELLGIVKQQDHKGRRIYAAFIGKYDPSEIQMKEILQVLCILADELITDRDFSVNGIIQILDISGISGKLLKIVTPQLLVKWVNIFYYSYPLRLEGYHILNPGSIFNIILKGIKIVIPKAIRDVIYLPGENGGLLSHISPSILPKSLGGDLDDENALVDPEILMEKVRVKEEYYVKFAQCLEKSIADLNRK